MKPRRNGSTESSGGIGFFGMLGVLFIGLKITGYIGWSWWWVLAPIWIPLAIVALILAGCGILIAVGTWARRKGAKA